jgi:hypothetical protein
MSDAVKQAAYQAVRDLATEIREYQGSLDSPRYRSLIARLSLAQVALAHPEAALGVCLEDGSNLHFRGDARSLTVTCANNHGWRIR